jgi:hypothetical protein
VGEVRKVTLEALEVLGQWRARLVVVSQDEEGSFEEPYVMTAEFRTLDYAGLGWQGLCVLQEAYQHLDAALRDGYE